MKSIYLVEFHRTLVLTNRTIYSKYNSPIKLGTLIPIRKAMKKVFSKPVPQPKEGKRERAFKNGSIVRPDSLKSCAQGKIFQYNLKASFQPIN